MNEYLITLKDEVGSLARLADEFAIRGVNILSIGGVFTKSTEIAVVTDHVQRTEAAIEKLGFEYEVRELLQVRLYDRPGELAHCCKNVSEAGINIESIFMMGKSGRNVDIALGVSDFSKAKEILKHYLVS